MRMVLSSSETIKQRRPIARGAILIETAIVLGLIAMVLSGTINFNMRLAERAALAESVRVAGRAAALFRNVRLTAVTPGVETLASVITFTDQILQTRLIDAGLRPIDYPVSIQAFRGVTTVSPTTPVAYLRIGVKSSGGVSDYFGAVGLQPACTRRSFELICRRWMLRFSRKFRRPRTIVGSFRNEV